MRWSRPACTSPLCTARRYSIHVVGILDGVVRVESEAECGAREGANVHVCSCGTSVQSMSGQPCVGKVVGLGAGDPAWLARRVLFLVAARAPLVVGIDVGALVGSHVHSWEESGHAMVASGL